MNFTDQQKPQLLELIRSNDIKGIERFFTDTQGCTNLNLRNDDIGPAGAIALAKALKHRNCKIDNLTLGWSGIGPKGTIALAEALKDHNCKIANLNLCNDDIGPEGAIALAEALKHRNCKIDNLTLSCNGIGPAGAIALAEALKDPNCKITNLILSWNIDPEGTIALAEALKDPNCKITNLDLSWNSIDHAGAIALAEALKDPNCKITNLNISHNTSVQDQYNIGPEVTIALVEAATQNKNLILIMVDSYGEQPLTQIFQQNKKDAIEVAKQLIAFYQQPPQENGLPRELLAKFAMRNHAVISLLNNPAELNHPEIAQQLNQSYNSETLRNFTMDFTAKEMQLTFTGFDTLPIEIITEKIINPTFGKGKSNLQTGLDFLRSRFLETTQSLTKSLTQKISQDPKSNINQALILLNNLHNIPKEDLPTQYPHLNLNQIQKSLIEIAKNKGWDKSEIRKIEIFPEVEPEVTASSSSGSAPQPGTSALQASGSSLSNSQSLEEYLNKTSLLDKLNFLSANVFVKLSPNFPDSPFEESKKTNKDSYKIHLPDPLAANQKTLEEIFGAENLIADQGSTFKKAQPNKFTIKNVVEAESSVDNYLRNYQKYNQSITLPKTPTGSERG